MLFQVLCGFEPIFYTTHPNEESLLLKMMLLLEMLLGFCLKIKVTLLLRQLMVKKD